MVVTKQTRFESYQQTDPCPIQRQVLDALNQPMTARQIAIKLGYSHPIVVRPRITELMKAGKIVSDDKAFDEVTQRTVAVFKRA